MAMLVYRSVPHSYNKPVLWVVPPPGNSIPINLQFATVTGRGDNPTYTVHNHSSIWDTPLSGTDHPTVPVSHCTVGPKSGPINPLIGVKFE